jgi:hypothetical protein
MRTVVGCLTLLSLGPVAVATAQYDYPVASYHSSTYEEGVQRGFADVVRSAGAANLMNSEAAKNYEDARRKYMDNRVYGTEKYFQMRQINKTAREAERGRQPTMEDLLRYASERAPSRLSPSELDPLTGQINWPGLLRDPVYAANRKTLEDLYAGRSVVGYLSPDQATEVGVAIDSMRAVMKQNVKTYPPQMYTMAKKFLESLAYESLQRPG